MNILLKEIYALLYEDGKFTSPKTNIYIVDDMIAGVGEEPEGFKADKVIDGHNKMVIPGLINAHTHNYMALLRNCADDLSFADWLFKNIEPLEEKIATKDAYWGASLSIMEMIRTGTTCFSDMQMFIHQTTQAVADSGIRAVISRGLVGEGNNEAGQVRLKEAKEEIARWSSNERITFLLGPHAPYSCDRAFLEIVAQEAKELDLGIHIHLSESVGEIEMMQKAAGCTPIEYVENTGIFDRNCIAAHCVQLTPKDMDILKAHNVNVVTNPASNMKLGNGFAPIPELMSKGINICLGTDGPASNNNLNMFQEMNLLTLIHKGAKKEAVCVGAEDALRFATVNGAKALGLTSVGQIAKGKKADLAILNLDVPQMMPKTNLISALCYSANGSEVETVIVNGKILMENRKILTMDEERIYFECQKIADRLGIGIKE
ncbi:MAG: amidohydrolase [Lachnospiraceae bacterium]|nr:amidohydrolase [Lachnospiraceae bacterium]